MTTVDRGIGVIGGGPAGLAAAWSLSTAGRFVRVYEARARPGGRLRTERVAGAGADAAVQLLSDGYDRFLRMVSDLGLRDRLVAVPGRDAIWRRGRTHTLRYGSVTSLAASGAIPAGLKLRLAMRYVPFLERNAAHLDLNDPSRAASAGLDAESIADWGARELGTEFVEYLAYPLLAAYYGVTPEETSAGLFHALAHAGMRVTVVGARGGAGSLMAEVTTALSGRGVELRTEWPVAELEAVEGGIRVRGGRGEVVHDAVVVATPAHEAARLVPGQGWLDAVRVRPTATLVLSLDSPLRTGWFGLSVPRVEEPGAVLSAVCVQEEKGTGVVGDGRGALVVMPAPVRAEWWASAAPGDILSEALPVLATLLPGIRSRIVEARVVRLPGGAFLPEPGHFDRVRLREAEAPAPRVALAGDYLVAPTVEGAVRSGLSAAETISRAGW